MLVKVDFDLELNGKVYSLQETGLKEFMFIPDTLEEDEVADWISDETSWCVKGWREVSGLRIFSAVYRWDGRCNSFERKVRIVTAQDEKEALSLLEKNDPDVNKDRWDLDEIFNDVARVENIIEVAN
jgi:hypothetical protein